MIYATAPDYTLFHLWQANIDKVQEEWNSPWVRAKAEAFFLRTAGAIDPLEVDETVKLARTSRYVAGNLCKDPGRQSSHQKIFGDWLATLPPALVAAPKALPNKGPESLHLFGGKVVRYATADERHAAADGKSIDFTWHTGGITVYAMHKHTDVEGGAQDNQHQDVRSFLKESRDNITKTERFVAVCDGAYYHRPSRKDDTVTRLEALRGICSMNGFAVTSAELPRWLMMVANGQA